MFKKIKRLLGIGQTENFIGFDKYRKRGAYHWEEVVNNVGYRSLIEAISQYIEPNDVALDIGCGDGAYLGFVAHKLHEGWGIDAEATATELAARKFKERQIANCYVRNLRIDQAKIFFDSTGKKFDLVWSADVIEHLPRPEELVELAVQVLKPQGRALIGTPLFISEELMSPYHVKEYTRDEISSIISPYLDIEEEIILPHARKDGRTYELGYYFAVCRLLPKH